MSTASAPPPASPESAPPAEAIPATGHPSQGPSTRRLLAIVMASLLVAAVMGALVSVALGPRATLTAERAGDAALLRDVEAAVGQGRGLQSVSVARVRNGTTTFAGLGGMETVGSTNTKNATPAPDTEYELGSITKTWTGMLLADAVKRGEMSLDAPIATYLPELKGSATGNLTAQQLATHTSGLPPLPNSGLATSLVAVATNTNPYAGISTDDVISAARDIAPGAPGTVEYSNLGMALLGHAEARAAGAADWATLARDRIFTPLKMTQTRVVDEVDADGAELALPHLENGLPTAGWASTGYAPAGSSTRTTAADMARFAQAIIDGTAPGMDALTPRADASGGRKIGLAWFTVTDQAGSHVWHNGGTGGSRTVIAVDRQAKTAAVAMGNSATGIDSLAPALLRPGTPTETPSAPPVSWVAAGLGLILALTASWKAWRGRSRLDLASGAIDAVTGAVVAWTRGAWNVLPEWMLGSILALAFAGVVYSMLRMRDVSTWPSRGRVMAVINLIVSVALLGLFSLAL